MGRFWTPFQSGLDPDSREPHAHLAPAMTLILLRTL